MIKNILKKIYDFLLTYVKTPLSSVWKKVKYKKAVVLSLIGLLYFLGIAAIIYPMMSNIVSLSGSRAVINNYTKTVEQTDKSDIDDRLERAEKYNADLAKGIYHGKDEKVLCGEDGLVCYVEVPSVNIYLPVYYGSTEEHLQKGAACLENTSLPVGGSSTHAVISAHTGLPTAEMFTDLDRVKKGEVFYIRVLDRVLAYKIDSIEAVKPNKTELLSIVKDKDYCTLLTCTPYGINDHRLLVRGERIEYTETVAEKTTPEAPSSERADEGISTEISKQMLVILLIVFISVIAYAAACIWVVRTGAKGKHFK